MQLGHNCKLCKNRRNELEVVVLDSEESDIEETSSEDKLTQNYSYQFSYILELNKTSYFF